MGAVAFAVLISVEVCLAVLAFGRSTTEHLASYASVAGAIGLAGTDPIRCVSGRAVLEKIECRTGGRLQAPLREPIRWYCTDTESSAKPAFPSRAL